MRVSQRSVNAYHQLSHHPENAPPSKLARSERQAAPSPGTLTEPTKWVEAEMLAKAVSV